MPGSLDDYYDIMKRLDELGASYILCVGIPGEECTRSWSDISDDRKSRDPDESLEYFIGNVEAMRRNINELCDKSIARALKDHDKL